MCIDCPERAINLLLSLCVVYGIRMLIGKMSGHDQLHKEELALLRERMGTLRDLNPNAYSTFKDRLLELREWPKKVK